MLAPDYEAGFRLGRVYLLEIDLVSYPVRAEGLVNMDIMWKQI